MLRDMTGVNKATFAAVTRYILDHDLRVGDPLPSELAFAQSVGVSRTVIRETFGALAAMRMIDVGNGRRARVGAVDGSMLGVLITHAVNTEQASVPQIWDARRALEQRTVELAAMRRTAREAEAITGHALAMRKAGGDLVAQTEHDIAFHAAIARASHNPVLALLVSSFADVMRETCPVGWRSRRDDAERQLVFDAHDRIAEAIADQDPEAAERAMIAHFASSLTALTNSGYN